MILPHEVGFTFASNMFNLTHLRRIKNSQENRKGPVPLFVYVYGGPGSQFVRENSNYLQLFTYLVNKYDVAVAGIDPVGTGYQGVDKMFRLEKLSQKVDQRLSALLCEYKYTVHPFWSNPSPLEVKNWFLVQVNYSLRGNKCNPCLSVHCVSLQDLSQPGW